MKGWIVVNSFINSKKFNELYEFFENSSKRLGISLEVKTTDYFTIDIASHFSGMALPDFVIFWDKDVHLAYQLEKAGVPVFNSARGIELCDNKILTALALNGKVRMPKTIIVPKTFEGVGYTNFNFLEKAVQELGLPIVIKEAYGSFGKQVYLAATIDEAKEILNKIGYKECLIQEFIASSKGRDARINVVGGKVVASMYRFNNSDFRSNISSGGSMRAYEPTKAEEEIAIKSCEALGLDFAGVDVMFGEDNLPYICEVNSNPHFKTTYVSTGVDMSEIILRYVKERA